MTCGFILFLQTYLSIKKGFFWFWFCFGFVLVLFWLRGLFSAVAWALFVCALVAGMATDADAVALATDVTIRGISVHKHLKHAEPVVQVVQHGMDVSDDRLSEFGKSVLEVLNEAQCHWNHDVHDHVRWGVFATLYLAPVENALPVLVDFLVLNLPNANDHFAMSHEVGQQRQNG